MPRSKRLRTSSGDDVYSKARSSSSSRNDAVSGGEEADRRSVSSTTDATVESASPAGSQSSHDHGGDGDYSQISHPSLQGDDVSLDVHANKPDGRSGTRGRRTSGYKSRR